VCAADPETRSITDHYFNYPLGLVSDGKYLATGTQGIAQGGSAIRRDLKKQWEAPAEA
jgi:hypothetical protein